MGCLPLSSGRKDPGCVQSYHPVAGNEGGKFSRLLTGLGSGEECIAVVTPVTTAGNGPNGTLTFRTQRKGECIARSGEEVKSVEESRGRRRCVEVRWGVGRR